MENYRDLETNLIFFKKLSISSCPVKKAQTPGINWVSINIKIIKGAVVIYFIGQ